MIKLTKGNVPEVLKINATAWTEEFLCKIRSGVKPSDGESSRYRLPQVKAALLSETHGKCAYCESKLRHIHHGDVEHISPKSLDPARRFEWENLTIACEMCNQNKSNKDPIAEHIIDPYNIDPAEHIIFLGAILYPLGSTHGKNTAILLDLNRTELVERRQERLDQVMSICETILRTDLPIVTRRAILENLVSEDAAPQASYSAMTKSAIKCLQERFDAVTDKPGS